MRPALAAIVLCAAGAAAGVPMREQARKVLEARRCGTCHDSTVSTEHPKALAVYDLHDPDWPAKMSNDRLPKLMTRLRAAPEPDQKLIQRFIAQELVERSN